jgi:hypothetical protein
VTKNDPGIHQVHYMTWRLVCGVLRVRRILSPAFFYKTVNLDWYVRNTLQPFFRIGYWWRNMYAYFQQDGANAHSANNSMRALLGCSMTKIISTGLWPPRSPDLGVFDLHLLGDLKGQVYRNPRTAEALQKIRGVIFLLRCGFLERCEVCLRAEIIKSW